MVFHLVQDTQHDKKFAVHANYSPSQHVVKHLHVLVVQLRNEHRVLSKNVLVIFIHNQLPDLVDYRSKFLPVIGVVSLLHLRTSHVRLRHFLLQIEYFLLQVTYFGLLNKKVAVKHFLFFPYQQFLLLLLGDLGYFVLVKRS